MRERFKSTLEFAYGYMEMSPIDLAGLTTYEFSLKCEGFSRKMRNEESLFRNVAWFAMAPHLGKNSRGIDYFWPLGDKKTDGALFTKKQIDANIAAYKAIREKRINNLLNLN